MASKPNVLVTAARGNTGQPVAEQLLEQNYPVRAFVHRHDEDAQRLEALGAEIVVGDLHDTDDVHGAVEGIQRAYFAHPPIPGTLYASTVFAEAASEADVEAIVDLSQWLARPDHPSRTTREHWLAERVFDRTGLLVTHLRPGYFADNYLLGLDMVAQFGFLPMPFGSGENPPPSNEDIARVAVGVLDDPEPHAGKWYRPTGPELLSPDGIAAAMTQALDRRVRYVDVPFWAFAKTARYAGVSEFFLSQVQFYLQDYREGVFAEGGPTSVVREIGGSEPEDFTTITRRYAQQADIQHGFKPKGRAAFDLTRALATSAPSQKRMKRLNADLF